MAVSIAFLQVIILFCLFYYFTQHICISLSTCPLLCCCAVDNILCSLDTWNMFCAKFACGHICTNGEVGMTARDPRHSVTRHLHHQVRDCLNNFCPTVVQCLVKFFFQIQSSNHQHSNITMTMKHEKKGILSEWCMFSLQWTEVEQMKSSVFKIRNALESYLKCAQKYSWVYVIIINFICCTFFK